MEPRRNTRAFTLIELLVVIAIIGLLSSVVLASLNTAREKGQDAAIKSELSQVFTQGQLYYDDHQNYGAASASTLAGYIPGYSTSKCEQLSNTMFSQDPKIKQAIQYAESISTIFICTVAGSTSVGTYNYQLSFNLPGSGKYWCVDSTGDSKEEPRLFSGTWRLSGSLSYLTCT